MALSRTNVGSFTGTGGTTFTTTAFTPANNSLLVVCAQLQDATIATDTMTITDNTSGGPLVWTARVTTGVDPGFSVHKSVIWTAPITTGASMTVTVGTLANGGAEFVIHIFTYTGHDVASPIGATAIGGTTGGSPTTITLSAAPATTSEVLASANEDSSVLDVVAGTGWTQQLQTTDGANVVGQTQTRTNSTSTTVQWNTVGVCVLAALEIKAAVASGGASLAKYNFKVDKFKKALGLGPNAGLFQVRAYPVAALVTQLDTSGQVIFRVRNQPWRW